MSLCICKGLNSKVQQIVICISVKHYEVYFIMYVHHSGDCFIRVFMLLDFRDQVLAHLSRHMHIQYTLVLKTCL